MSKEFFSKFHSREEGEKKTVSCRKVTKQYSFFFYSIHRNIVQIVKGETQRVRDWRESPSHIHPAAAALVP